MNIREVATLLRMTPDEVKISIKEGIELPATKLKIKLKAELLGKKYEIDEASLNEFIDKFHQEEPGRHPPAKVRRKLLVEARHRCAICEEVKPIEFHHIIEFSKLKHYDIDHMMVLCPTCHTLCGNGIIDSKAQREYKNRLNNKEKGEDVAFKSSIAPLNFSWGEVKTVIQALHTEVVQNSNQGDSKFDLSDADLNTKNRINKLSQHYFETVMLEAHEPYFNRIFAFLRNPINSKVNEQYFEIVDELRSKIAANRNDFISFEFFLVTFADVAKVRNGVEGINRRALNILLSFMYINCDIGKKE